MNSLGRYRLRSPQIQPATFLTANWKFLCGLVGLSPVPKMYVFSKKGLHNVNTTATTVIFAEAGKEEISICKEDFEIYFLTTPFPGNNHFGKLWSALVGLARPILVHRNIIKPHQRISVATVKGARWSDKFINTLAKISEHEEESEEVIDMLIIQYAILCYFARVPINATLDAKKLATIILSKRESLDIDLFRIKRR
jgi:hypothetical protein